jgi:hypothetical protein
VTPEPTFSTTPDKPTAGQLLVSKLESTAGVETLTSNYSGVFKRNTDNAFLDLPLSWLDGNGHNLVLMSEQLHTKLREAPSL